MDFSRIAKRHKEKLEEEISLLKKQIKEAPEGQFKLVKNGKRYKWYVMKESGDRIYIPKKDQILAARLAKKSYNKRLLSIKEKSLKALNIFINRCQSCENYAENLLVESEEFARLINIGIQSNMSKIERWISEDYERNPNHPEHLTIRTVNGLYVRSKSEAYIASELAGHSIPFRYEQALEISGILVYPDFTILNPITEEIILWEHLGMIDDENYLNNALVKLRTYIKGGYIPTINLILTYETRNEPLDFTTVQKMIQLYFEF